MKTWCIIWGIAGALSIVPFQLGAQDAEAPATPVPSPSPKKNLSAKPVPVNDPQFVDKLKAAGANLSPQVLEIVRMSDAGADASVIQAYVENSAVAYTPRADEIIYLHDHGIPASIITAMIQRGAKVREQSATTQANAEPQPAQSAPASPTYAVQQTAPNYVAEAPYAYYPSYAYSYPSYYAYPYYGYPGFYGPSFSFGFYARPYGFGHSYYGHSFYGHSGLRFSSPSHFGNSFHHH